MESAISEQKEVRSLRNCRKCKNECEFLTITRYEVFPDILVIHPNHDKNTKWNNFPISFNVNQKEYKLFAVVNLSNSHYTAIARSQNDKDIWVSLNDAYVRILKEDIHGLYHHDLKPYLLFYE